MVRMERGEIDMLTIDYPTLKEIIGKVAYDRRSPIYFFEDKKKFVLFFTDGMWKYASIISKDEIKSFVPHSNMDKDYIDFIREFRKRNLEGAVRILGYDYDISEIQPEDAKTPDETELVTETPSTDELPFQTKEPESIVDEVNETLAKEGKL